MAAPRARRPGRLAEPRIEPFGDGAILVTFAEVIDAEANARAHALAERLAVGEGAGPDIGRPVPAHASVLVPFDPRSADASDVIERVRQALTAIPARPAVADLTTGRPLQIEVRYGGPDGPDLEEVAERCGLGPDDVVALHAGATYRVAFLGFAPGFAYLGPLPAAIALPRRATPRERIPAGSVAIAGEQTAIYPFDAPAGWHVIGRTDVRPWDLARPRPNLLAPGERVRFVPAR